MKTPPHVAKDFSRCSFQFPFKPNVTIFVEIPVIPAYTIMKKQLRHCKHSCDVHTAHSHPTRTTMREGLSRIIGSEVLLQTKTTVCVTPLRAYARKTR